MKKRNIYLIIATAIFTTIGCSRENSNSNFEDIPVVESYLYAEQSLEVKVSRQVPYTSDAMYSSDDLDALNIKILDGNLEYNLTSMGDGKYTNPNINIRQLKTFELEFNYNNLPVSAVTTIPVKPENFASSATNLTVSDGFLGGIEPKDLKFSWDNLDNSHYFILIENIESNPNPIYENSNVSSNSQLFNLPPTQADHYSLNTRLFTYYGNYRIVLFHINPDLATLYNNSDTSSQNISNPPTALKNAFGIFTGVNSDTLYVNIQQ